MDEARKSTIQKDILKFLEDVKIAEAIGGPGMREVATENRAYANKLLKILEEKEK